MMNAQTLNPWFICFKPNSDASLRLFCFPYSGGSAQIYQDWTNSLPKTIEVCSLQLPGRGIRWNEASFTRLIPLVQAITQPILPFLERPFAFFGHSMGSLIAFELARELRRNHGLSPIHFFASGHAAPHIMSSRSKIHLLSDAEIVKHIRYLNGTPPSLLENEELMNMVIPALKADFAVCETYTYRHEPPLSCSITAFGGADDYEVNRNDLEAWGEHTTGDFSMLMFHGDHFFLHTARCHLLSIITQKVLNDKMNWNNHCKPL